MKVEITERQLLAIQEICESVNATLGDGGFEEGHGSDFDKIMRKELTIVERFFKKNGYVLSIEKNYP